jgi:hypothetical protein
MIIMFVINNHLPEIQRLTQVAGRLSAGVPHVYLGEAEA